MMAILLDPFGYSYMTNAMWVSALVGCVCAFLSAFLMLKGWSLIGDALSHSVVPGVAGAYMLGLPFALGAFIAGGLAAGSMLFLSERSGLKIDVIIGLIFTSFFGLGLFMVSINPMAISIQTITMGNILAITPEDTLQLALIGIISLIILTAKWKDLMVTFFDESHARTIGLNPPLLKAIFFMLLSASVVAAMQTVGAFLVIAMVVTPRRNGLPVLRPVPSAYHHRNRHWSPDRIFRCLYQLFSGWRHWWCDRYPANAAFPDRFSAGPEARIAGSQTQGQRGCCKA